MSLLSGVLPKSEIWKIWLWPSQTPAQSLVIQRAAGHRPALQGLGQDVPEIAPMPISKSAGLERVARWPDGWCGAYRWPGWTLGGTINAAISRVAATGHCGGGGFSVVGLNDGGLDSGT